MIARNCEGRLPEPGKLAAADEKLLAAADAMIGEARAAMKSQQLHQALNAVWAVVADANRYFAAAAPWALKKTDPARMAAVLWTTAEVTRQIAILAQPFVPAGAARLLDLLAVPAGARSFASLGKAGRLKPGTALPAPAPVFPRYVEAVEAASG
jgi:methionyl-tRNA synthetase